MCNLSHEESSDKPKMEMSNALFKGGKGVKCQRYKRQRKAVEIFQDKGG